MPLAALLIRRLALLLKEFSPEGLIKRRLIFSSSWPVLLRKGAGSVALCLHFAFKVAFHYAEHSV
jgi:hypothetical protein